MHKLIILYLLIILFLLIYILYLYFDFKQKRKQHCEWLQDEAERAVIAEPYRHQDWLQSSTKSKKEYYKSKGWYFTK